MTDRLRQGPGELPDQPPSERRPFFRGAGAIRALPGVMVLLVAAAPVYFDIVQPVMQGDAPAAAVRQLCADEMRHDYVGVFQLLSARWIARYSLKQDEFVQVQQGRDQQFGRVQTCAIVSRDYVRSLFNTGAAFRVAVTLSTKDTDTFGTTYTDTGTIGLVNEHGWKVNYEEIDAALFLAG